MAAPTRTVTASDIARMSDALFIFAGPDASRKASKFWVLLALSAVIASAGVIVDSTATVIGAMIVAPLMTPILGTGFAIVLADRANVLKSAGLVVGGALTVIAIGFAMGVINPVDTVAATNGQVAGRVSPGIFDLLAALATGVVGAFALVRSDVSDTLPGVAIAISLVPPLAVVGLTLESGAPDESWGALLLFFTNVAAMIATATVMLLVYPVRAAAKDAGVRVRALRGRTLLVVVGAVVLLAVPLLYGSVTSWLGVSVVHNAEPVTTTWAEDAGWQVTDVSYTQGTLEVVVIGQPPQPEVAELRSALDETGLAHIPAHVVFVRGDEAEVPVITSSGS